jgi:hypothetical protein
VSEESGGGARSLPLRRRQHRHRWQASLRFDPFSSALCPSLYLSTSLSPSAPPPPSHRNLAMARPPSAAIKPPYPAFHSHPSDLELVNSYLHPWVETGVKTGAPACQFTGPWPPAAGAGTTRLACSLHKLGSSPSITIL